MGAKMAAALFVAPATKLAVSAAEWAMAVGTFAADLAAVVRPPSADSRSTVNAARPQVSMIPLQQDSGCSVFEELLPSSGLSIASRTCQNEVSPETP